MDLCALLRQTLEHSANRTAVALGDRAVCSYAELAGRAAALGTAMQQRLGVRSGDRVILLMSNAPEYVELLFGCWHAGVLAVPVNAKLHASEVRYIVEDCGARVCFVGDNKLSLIEAAATEFGAQIITPASRDYRELLNTEPAPPAPVAGHTPAWLFYTSGTTGNPKGATLSHGNLLTMTASYSASVDRIEAGEAIMHAAPMSHGSGIYILPHIAHGAINVVPESGGFEPHELIELLPHYPGTTLFAAPTMVKRLVNAVAEQGASMDSLKTLVYGGGPMYVADLDLAHDVLGYRLAQIYGQGESPMTITALDKAQHRNTGHPRYRERIASVGTAQASVQLAVIDEAGERLPCGEAGEVLVRGPSVMLGYWHNETATRATLRDGWLYTGDIGHLDEDGFLTLVDRSKDVIISGGSNIYPREVEEVLLRHPAVSEVAVIGRSDPEWGERVVAFVVADPRPAEQELDRHCLDHLARFKRPREYVWRDTLPKNNYGKVLKRALRDA